MLGDKNKFTGTSAYIEIKKFLDTNVLFKENSPVVYLIIEKIFKKIIETELSTEPSRYANKNCQVIFQYLNDLNFEDLNIFEICESSVLRPYGLSNSSNLNDKENNTTLTEDLFYVDTLESKKLNKDEFLENSKLKFFGEKEKQNFAKNKEKIKISEKDLEILKLYLKNSFGNSQRCDFGTGHELNFICFLYSLNKFIEIDIKKSLEYYQYASRSFILKFKLEAAGSKGIWGVDDYEIISFLVMGKIVQRRYFKKNLRECSFDFFIKNLLRFVCTYKLSTDLYGNSPFLFDLLSKSGADIVESLEERIDRELLGSFVVTQHFIFSDFLSK